MQREEFEIEICTGNIDSVFAAAKAGANRVEMCENLLEGGTTPSYGSVRVAVEQADVDVAVIIRPRGGDFVYSEAEMQVMLHDIVAFRELGAYAVVIGCLNADGTVNREQNRRLIEAAGSMQVTFHRAFDVTPDPMEALDAVLELGCHRILTSGQQPSAFEGRALLKALQHKAGTRLKIMAGGGVTESNIAELALESGVKAFHGTIRDAVPVKTEFVSDVIAFNGFPQIQENVIKVANVEKIKTAINNLINTANCS